MATRYLGKHTKITLQWMPANGYPAWVEGHYAVSFNVGGKKVDAPTLHVFKGPHTQGTKAIGRTPDDLGIDPSEMNTPNAYDLVAEWACESLISGSQQTPHWRYGRAKTVAQALWRDMEENGDEIRRRR